jgi:chromosome segregation ATPase
MSDEKYLFEVVFDKRKGGGFDAGWVGKIQDQQTHQSEFLHHYDDAIRFMKARLPHPGFSQQEEQSQQDPLRNFAEDVTRFVNDMAPQVAAFWQRSVDTLGEQAANLQHRMRESKERARENWDQNSDKARDHLADLLGNMQQQLDHISSRLQDLEHSTRKGKDHSDGEPKKDS